MGRGGSKAGGGLPTLNPSGSGSGGGDFSPNTVGFKNIPNLRSAIGTKGRMMSMENAARGANPNYNPAYGEFSENCQRCVVAYEMRRRGYDVTAQPSFKGDTMGETAFTSANNKKFLRLTGAFQGAKTESVGATTSKKTLSNIKDTMSGYGDGSRAIMTFGWKRGNAGHAINVELKNGKLHFNDAQVGGKYDGAKLMNAIKTKSVTLTRTDNLKVSERMKKSVEPSGRRK